MNDHHTIFSCHESGSTSSWEWSVVMYPNQSGSYDVRFEQTIWDCNEEDEPSLYKISDVKDGVVLFNFLKDSWYSEHQEDFDLEQWEEIITNISKVDITLADEVGGALQREGDEEDMQISDIQILRVIGVERVGLWIRVFKVFYKVETSNGPAFLYPPTEVGIGYIKFGSLGMGAGSTVKVRLTKEINNQLQELKQDFELLMQSQAIK